MHRPAGTARREYQKKATHADLSLLRPVGHQQLLLLDLPHDLRLGLWDKFPPPPEPALEAAFHQFVTEHARRHGWSKGKTATVQRAIRIMLGIQDTPGAAIRRSDGALLTRIKHSAAVVADVLTAAGMLVEDREPTIVRWFNKRHREPARVDETPSSPSGSTSCATATRSPHAPSPAPKTPCAASSISRCPRSSAGPAATTRSGR
jgi:hypothetical protein